MISQLLLGFVFKPENPETAMHLSFAIFAGCLAAGLIYIGLFVDKYRRKLLKKDAGFVNQEWEFYKNDERLSWADSQMQVIKRFELLTDRKKMLELSIDSSRYIALQQQINPHFLYNALDAIRSDMLIEGDVKIAEAIEALSKYFSYSISNLEHLATISEELGNVSDYFSIQKYRFGDRLKLKVVNEMGEDKIREAYIPRLTIQPLVENAILHGLETSNREGTVTIELKYMDSDIVIKVCDDGSGMPVEKLDEINQNLYSHKEISRDRTQKPRGGIAMYNVNSRIKLLFGEKYGIRLYSIKNVGTQVVVYLPNVLEDYMDEQI